jgi:hypothetical protein
MAIVHHLEYVLVIQDGVVPIALHVLKIQTAIMAGVLMLHFSVNVLMAMKVTFVTIQFVAMDVIRNV